MAKAKAMPVSEPPAAPVPVGGSVPAPYPHELPRILHKPRGHTLRVDTVVQCDEALADGWTLRPVPETPEAAD